MEAHACSLPKTFVQQRRLTLVKQTTHLYAIHDGKILNFIKGYKDVQY